LYTQVITSMFLFNVYSCVEEDYNYVIMYPTINVEACLRQKPSYFDPTINVEACLRQKPSYVESISHILNYLQQVMGPEHTSF
jgi:hypothetical protein